MNAWNHEYGQQLQAGHYMGKDFQVHLQGLQNMSLKSVRLGEKEEKAERCSSSVWGQILHCIISLKTYLFYFAFSYAHAGQDWCSNSSSQKNRWCGGRWLLHIFAPVVGDDDQCSANKKKCMVIIPAHYHWEVSRNPKAWRHLVIDNKGSPNNDPKYSTGWGLRYKEKEKEKSTKTRQNGRIITTALRR